MTKFLDSTVVSVFVKFALLVTIGAILLEPVESTTAKKAAIVVVAIEAKVLLFVGIAVANVVGLLVTRSKGLAVVVVKFRIVLKMVVATVVVVVVLLLNDDTDIGAKGNLGQGLSMGGPNIESKT